MPHNEGTEELLAGIENAAARIINWECLRIPGLAQTAALTAATLEAMPAAVRLGPEAIAAKVRLRQQRQRIVFEDMVVPPEVVLLLGEAAIHSLAAAEAELARDQFWHLLDLSESGRASVRIAAFSSGLVTWPQSPIHLVYGQRGPTLMLEGVHRHAQLLTSPDLIMPAEQDIAHVLAHALDERSSLRLIARIGGIRYRG